jgi:hypothetical protein
MPANDRECRRASICGSGGGRRPQPTTEIARPGANWLGGPFPKAGRAADFGKVVNARFENGTISIEDTARHRITLRASLPLSDQP